ncbi:protein kinase family protein [Dermatophilaceae bacterium Sec6.4]
MQELSEGVALAERYELVTCVGTVGDHRQWHATDRTLDRSVTAITFPSDDPYAEAALDSARRAAGVDDHHLLRILDVGVEGDWSYVVTERLHDAESVTELLQFQTLPPEEARRIVGEAAAGLHTAAARGLHHLCLTPHDIVRSRDGSVTVLGVATDSALTGLDDVPAGQASRTDAEALVQILYTALTGRWPGPDAVPDLPAATRDAKGVLAAPAAVVTRVPSDLDTVCRQVLIDGSGPSTPGDLARLLSPWSAERVHGAGGRDIGATGHGEKQAEPVPTTSTVRYFESAGASAGLVDSDGDETQFHDAGDVPILRSQRDPSDVALEPPAPYLPSGLDEPDRRTSGLALGIVALLLVLTVVAAFYGLRGLGGGSSPTAGPTSSTSAVTSSKKAPASSAAATSSTTPAGTPIKVVSATGFDPEGNNNEHNELAPLVIDGNDSTMWVTHIYRTAQFSGIKKGAGLLLDLGASKQVGSVEINVVGNPTTLQVFVTDKKSITGATPFGTLNNGSGNQKVTGTPTTGRYVIVWITSLSQFLTNGYRDQIAQVKVTS